MNIEKKDIRKKKYAPIVITFIMVTYFLFMIVSIFWAGWNGSVSLETLIIPAVPCIVMIVVIMTVFLQRIKEINGGEEDEASKY